MAGIGKGCVSSFCVGMEGRVGVSVIIVVSADGWAGISGAPGVTPGLHPAVRNPRHPMRSNLSKWAFIDCDFHSRIKLFLKKADGKPGSINYFIYFVSGLVMMSLLNTCHFLRDRMPSIPVERAAEGEIIILQA
jgi:hypothetical protein